MGPRGRPAPAPVRRSGTLDHVGPLTRTGWREQETAARACPPSVRRLPFRAISTASGKKSVPDYGGTAPRRLTGLRIPRRWGGWPEGLDKKPSAPRPWPPSRAAPPRRLGKLGATSAKPPCPTFTAPLNLRGEVLREIRAAAQLLGPGSKAISRTPLTAKPCAHRCANGKRASSIPANGVSRRASRPAPPFFAAEFPWPTAHWPAIDRGAAGAHPDPSFSRLADHRPRPSLGRGRPPGRRWPMVCPLFKITGLTRPFNRRKNARAFPVLRCRRLSTPTAPADAAPLQLVGPARFRGALIGTGSARLF